MKRAQKIDLVEQLSETFSNTPHVILTTFKGLTVNQATNLRGRIREAGGKYTVIKNRLAKRAAAGTPVEELSQRFTGPCAIATHTEDPIVLAKTLAEFSKENPELSCLAGVIDARELVDEQGVKQLASLPGLPELRAQLLALTMTPATTLVRLLNTPGSQLARVLDSHRQKLEDSA